MFAHLSEAIVDYEDDITTVDILRERAQEYRELLECAYSVLSDIKKNSPPNMETIERFLNELESHGIPDKMPRPTTKHDTDL